MRPAKGQTMPVPSEAARHARAMLFDGENAPSQEIAPHRTAAATAWALLAVADAISALAQAVEDLHPPPMDTWNPDR